MLVNEIMSSHPTMVGSDTRVKDAARKMRDLDVGCLLVGSRDEIIGIITDRDITCRGVADGLDFDELPVRQIMTEDPIWCYENEDIEDAVRIMEQKQIRRLPVFDDNKHLTGILTVGDVSVHTPHELSGEVIEAISQPPGNRMPLAAEG